MDAWTITGAHPVFVTTKGNKFHCAAKLMLLAPTSCSALKITSVASLNAANSYAVFGMPCALRLCCTNLIVASARALSASFRALTLSRLPVLLALMPFATTCALRLHRAANLIVASTAVFASSRA